MWVGVSVGGLIAALMVAGYSPEELYNVIKNPEDLLGDHDARKVMVESLLQKRGFSPTVTLRDFAAATKKTLILVATSLNRGGPVYLSHMTAPDTTVVDAACATSAIPLYFPPVSFDGDTFVDGCISDPYPVDIACITRPTLGIRIKDSAHPGMCGASVLGVGSHVGPCLTEWK
ncbi:FabD/lysophospholipase-like protein [Gonapodya prolifera JEL478]|uniref:FabD/lysophospholipase-like protein n=1 Tax=Gonapodya prolifera (strain JEL478) TaxID=1344416 RepID=A0A138ZX22_GONPJ|nr:FabD/lysophospholipase-like protein [Gonapodya prolifera JEL478]|eukprot:KXS09059.1 FabD/lysophospholipase-like protein [Gonapodya prolifera JEL478]